MVKDHSAREETYCHYYMGYSFRWHLAARVLLYAPFHRQDSTYHGLFYTSLFNDALSTFYLRLYGVRHIVKDHSDSEKGNSFRLAARVLLYASSHRQDNTYHSLCYTSRGNSSMDLLLFEELTLC